MIMLVFKHILLLVTVVKLCETYQFLVIFGTPGRSHLNLGNAFVKHLLEAGHQVTYITTAPTKSPPPGLRQVDVSVNYNIVPTEAVFDIEKLVQKDTDFNDLNIIFQLFLAISNSTVNNANVQRLLHDPKEKFDAVIAEWMYNDIYSGFAPVFNCPLIWSSSMEPHSLVLNLVDQDTNPSYTADIYSQEVPPYTFWERAYKLWVYIDAKIQKWRVIDTEVEIYERAFSSAAKGRGRELPPYDVARYNGSLILGNSHVSTGHSISLPQSYIPIGGYHIDSNTPPLPADLQSIMDSATKGVVYFSMGSLLNCKALSNSTKNSLVKMFGNLKYTVIWKIGEKIPNAPKNLHFLDWAPQQSILAHPNCKLFISHGGLLSITEAVHYGVPVIAIPIFADQFSNANRIEKKGFGKRVDFDVNIANTLKEVVDEVLGDPKYRAKVKDLSVAYHDRLESPGWALTHWVQHVIRTRGAPHLRSPAVDMPFYQKVYLDLLALILLVLVILISLARIIIYKLVGQVSEKKKNN